MRFGVAFLSFVCIFITIQVAHGKRLQGLLETSTSENWKFLTRFCFLNGTGTLQFYFTYPMSYLTQSLLLYWDKPNLWRSAYSNKSMTCSQKEALLDIRSSQIFRLNTALPFCFIENNNTVVCATERITFLSARERWWFLAISNCLADKGLFMKYDVIMRNGNPGDLFREHFSADEIYILEFNIAFFFIELLMVVLVVVVSVKLTNMQMFHSSYKIFLCSVVFFFASIIVTCAAYLSYATNGFENSGLKYFASALYATSQILLVLMLLLLSLGYTVVCGRLPHWGVICLSVFMTSFVITNVALYIVEAATFDPALVLYRYESSPGYGLMAIILASWLFFLASCIFTMSKHKKKLAFYAPMLVFYSLWFIAIPVTVVINIQQVPDYTRAKVVNFIEVISLFLAHVFYLVLTWPSLANKNFPFHIKTTQIGVISFAAANGMAEQDEVQKRTADLADGRQFTDFSVFTVPDQRSNSVSASANSTTATNFGLVDHGGNRSGGSNGSSDSDWDSGVVLPTAAAAIAADSGSDSGGAARLLVVGGFNDGLDNLNSYDIADGQETVEAPVAVVVTANRGADNPDDDYDNYRSESSSMAHFPAPDAAVAGDEPADVPEPEWMRSGPLGDRGSRGGTLPPI